MENQNPCDGYRHIVDVLRFLYDVSQRLVHSLYNFVRYLAVSHFILLFRSKEIHRRYRTAKIRFGEKCGMKKGINRLLLITFVVTMLAPITGLFIHKMASGLFLLLCLVHTILYRKKMFLRRIGVLLLTILSFLTGAFALIFHHITIFAALHVVLSVFLACFLAVHIFVFKNGFSKGAH